jgi:threonylcarbamoyladenosine tRNA methylthiotransferase MtaB
MNINLDTVGCRLNQSEIEAIARQFVAAGHALVPTPADADLVVLNTCAVTAAAASDSRQKTRQANRAGVDKIILTGCWATLEPDEATALPGVARVVHNKDKDRLVPDYLGLNQEDFELEPIIRKPVPGARLRTRAFIKVQDGCDNRCTFCVTTIARGPGRSRPLETILSEVEGTIDRGVREVVLTGVHLGSWGQDLSPNAHLKDLVEALLVETSGARLRLSSLEPWDLDKEFFSLWEDPRLCRHLHLPLQSGSAATLRRMARKTTPESFAALMAAARAVSPEIAITTDLITGFPGETEAEFEASLNFVETQEFAGGHVFTFSPRAGTAAATMPNQVHAVDRKERNAQMREVFLRSAATYQSRFIGCDLDVLWESATAMGPDVWTLSGLTDNYMRVTAKAPKPYWNQITKVRLMALNEKGFAGSFNGSSTS